MDSASAARRTGRDGSRIRPRSSRPGEIAIFRKMHDQRVEILRIGHGARRIICALRSERRPSLKATAPASSNRPNSAISLPLQPLGQRGHRQHPHLAVSRARRLRKSTTAGSSTGGLVSGRATKVVTPPAAAAAVAVAMVSRYSAPGSPTKAACRSARARRYRRRNRRSARRRNRLRRHVRADRDDESVARPERRRCVSTPRAGSTSAR